ncbi:MAG: hypothetical protein HOO00_02345 [Rhodospirillaceae bacterium]|jgi:hypothetical protein|nr:hypothetical protein [Rhodospirillaceae bacterium]MBT5752095.1 hypothetical protein [Rhodospirillaceae bacterium]
MMRIGIDFDNTLVDSRHLFIDAVRRKGWGDVPLNDGKKALRDAIRLMPDGESHWRKIQAEVYGARMSEAVMLEGAGNFLATCRENETEICIVSHKTKYAAAEPGGVDLHAVSLDWMRSNGFFEDHGFAINEDCVFFEPTRADKIARIAAINCQWFVDDLVEVLADPEFPDGVRRYLIGGTEADALSGIKAFRSWPEISDDIFGN